jgi:hypothetical protein
MLLSILIFTVRVYSLRLRSMEVMTRMLKGQKLMPRNLRQEDPPRTFDVVRFNMQNPRHIVAAQSMARLLSTLSQV